MTGIRRWTACFAVALLAGPSAAGAQDIAFETSELVIETADARHRFTVELADSPRQRERGLMFRTELAADRGMLFDYVTSQPVAMWMKNTLIPLDMLFVDEDGIIRRIESWTTPLSLAPIESGGPVRAVIELRGGIARQLGIEPGDRVLHARFGG